MSYADYVEKPTDDAFAELNALAIKLKATQDAVTAAEVELKKAKEEFRQVSEVELPEKMESMGGLEHFRTTSGLEIEVDEVIRAGISKQRAPAAYAWLRKHKHGKLIKNTLTVVLGKGDDERADELAEQIKAAEFTPERKESVHPSTLQAFVKQTLKAGKDLPLDLFGVHRQRVAKIK